jgi:predicted nuclease of predicted toxin-antitoxin system
VSVFRGHPPKVVWVRLGNASVATTIEFFRVRQDIITAFAADPEAGFLALG